MEFAAYTSESALERQLQGALMAMLNFVGVTLSGEDLLVFPIVTQPGHHLVIVPEAQHEAIYRVGQQIGLRPVQGYRGLWVYAPLGSGDACQWLHALADSSQHNPR